MSDVQQMCLSLGELARVVPDSMTAEKARDKDEEPLLPSDVLSLVLLHCHPPTLATSLRVSMDMYDLASPLLYRRVELELRNDTFPRAWTPAQLLGRLYTTLCHQKPSLPRPALFSHFSHTTHLTLAAHPEGLCSHLLPLDLPNLVVLRVLPYEMPFDSPHLDLCQTNLQWRMRNRFRYWPRDGEELRIAAGCCYLLRTLRPRRIIVGPSKSQTPEAGGWGMWTSSETTCPPDFIEEIILLLANTHRLSLHNEREIGPTIDEREKQFRLDQLPATIKRLTLIVDDLAAGDAMRRPWDSPPPRYGPGQFPSALAAALQGDATVVEVVGLETHWLAGSCEESACEKLREGLRKFLVIQGMKAVEAERRVEGLIVTNGQDFVARHEDCTSGFLELGFEKAAAGGGGGE